MKAAVMHEANKPLVIEDVTINKPAAREVLLRTAYARPVPLDLHFIEGLYPHPAARRARPRVRRHRRGGRLPRSPTSRRATTSSPASPCSAAPATTARRAALHLHRHQREDAPRCRQAAQPRRQAAATFTNLSSYAEMMLVHENALVKVGNDFPLDRAALIGCGIIDGYGAAVNTAEVAPGENVAVIGGGGVGMAAINGAAIAGAGRIIAIDTNPVKLQLATKLGATDLINPRDGDPVQQVKDLMKGGVHHAIECLGTKATAEQAFQMLSAGGTATIVGMVPFGQKIELHGFDFLRERKIQGSSMGSNRFRVDMPRLIQFYQQRKLHLDDWISDRIKLSEINEGFANMKAGKVVRSVIQFAA